MTSLRQRSSNAPNGSATNLITSDIYETKGWTNDVLIYKHRNKTQLYVPCYMRTKLKNIVSLDVENMKGKINVLIILSIYYGELDQRYPEVYQALQQNVVLKFKIESATQLKQGTEKYTNRLGEESINYITKKVNKKQKLITFSIRRMLLVSLNCQIFWSPFQYIEYVSTINVSTIHIKNNIKIHFNLMNLSEKKDVFQVAAYTDEGGLGEYDLAENLIRAQFSNQRFFSEDNAAKSHTQNKAYSQYAIKSEFLNQESQALVTVSKVRCFQYGHFIYPIYRQAFVTLLNLFFPIIMLGFLNLAIFLQDNKRPGKKMLNIAALMVSYIALLPSIRKKIPPSSTLVLSEILIFAMAAITLLCEAQTIQTRLQPQKWYLQTYTWQSDGLFVAALVFTLLLVFILLVVAFVFHFYVIPYYKKKVNKTDLEFKRQNWSNSDCDEYFLRVKRSNINIKKLTQYISSQSGAYGKKRNEDWC